MWKITAHLSISYRNRTDSFHLAEPKAPGVTLGVTLRSSLVSRGRIR
jgi:hypothetical protein